eukprot:gene7562-5439_t
MSESKEEETKVAQMLDVVQEFCTSDEFEGEFERFAKEHADAFEQSVDFSTTSHEHPMEFHTVYLEYLRHFEGMIEDFIVKNGFTVAEFHAECRRILDKEDVFGRRRFFIEKMLAISEYENFFILMQSEMQLRRLASKK